MPLDRHCLALVKLVIVKFFFASFIVSYLWSCIGCCRCSESASGLSVLAVFLAVHVCTQPWEILRCGRWAAISDGWVETSVGGYSCRPAPASTCIHPGASSASSHGFRSIHRTTDRSRAGGGVPCPGGKQVAFRRGSTSFLAAGTPTVSAAAATF
jgi:hypothetical protein